VKKSVFFSFEGRVHGGKSIGCIGQSGQNKKKLNNDSNESGKIIET